MFSRFTGQSYTCNTRSSNITGILGFLLCHLTVIYSSQKKLETFRIKELKDVLSRIGAAKQGKKQVHDLALFVSKMYYFPLIFY
jgi:hypothetical protein